MDREVIGSNTGGFFCTHKEELIYAKDHEFCLTGRSRAILPTFVGLCVQIKLWLARDWKLHFTAKIEIDYALVYFDRTPRAFR